MGFRGGVKLTPPQHILVFKYPSRDRVNLSILRKLNNPFNIFRFGDAGSSLQNNGGYDALPGVCCSSHDTSRLVKYLIKGSVRNN